MFLGACLLTKNLLNLSKVQRQKSSYFCSRYMLRNGVNSFVLR